MLALARLLKGPCPCSPTWGTYCPFPSPLGCGPLSLPRFSSSFCWGVSGLPCLTYWPACSGLWHAVTLLLTSTAAGEEEGREGWVRDLCIWCLLRTPGKLGLGPHALLQLFLF